MYVTIELVKVVGSLYFISKDLNMYDPSNGKYAIARTSNLNEELGMV